MQALKGQAVMDMQRYATIRAMVEKIYQLSASGQWDDVEAMLTDDFFIVEADSMPYPGRVEGKGALQTLYGKVFGYWDDPVLDMDDICISENNAIVLATMTATSRHNGERISMPLAEVLHVRDAQFCGITPYYFDTTAIARASGVLAA